MQSKDTTKYNFAKWIKKGLANETAKPISDPAILKAAGKNASSSNASVGGPAIKRIQKIQAAPSSIFDIKKEEPD